MKNKVVTASEAIALLRDGDTLVNTGFVGCGAPEDLLVTLEQRYLETRSPHNLTLLFAAGQGDGAERGLNRLGHDGLLKRVIGGHWGLIPKVAKLALTNQIEGYNLPQGVIAQLYRAIASRKPGVITKVGLKTFVDPRLEGGKINAISTEDLVELIELGGEEWLYYKSFPINVAFCRGTTADPNGNVTMEKEALFIDNLAMAMAAKNSGGLVIVQVERIAEAGSLNPKQVKIPGVLVDCVVVARPEYHAQTYGLYYDPSFAAQIRVPLGSLPALPLDERKLIARRCVFELPPGGCVNLGIGMPEGVASVANEEQILRYVTLTTEPGGIGGVPQGGLNFGAGVNMDAVVDQNQQFDFYDGGGLDMTCLGLAECDEAGNLNVSRFGPKLAGAGGFINISQNARKVVFAGTFSAGGLKTAVEDGKLRIVQEGRAHKFVKQVGQVTFSGTYAKETHQPVLFVTERCVFRLTPDGLALTEVAPGIDIERDILAHMDFAPIVETWWRWTLASSARSGWGWSGTSSASAISRAASATTRSATFCSSTSRACACGTSRTWRRCRKRSRAAASGSAVSSMSSSTTILSAWTTASIDDYAKMIRYLEKNLLRDRHPLYDQRLHARQARRRARKARRSAARLRIRRRSPGVPQGDRRRGVIGPIASHVGRVSEA